MEGLTCQDDTTTRTIIVTILKNWVVRRAQGSGGHKEENCHNYILGS